MALGEVQLGVVPDPFGSVADHDLLFRTAPAALPRFQIDPFGKLFRGFNRADAGGRIGVADSVASVDTTVPGECSEGVFCAVKPKAGKHFTPATPNRSAPQLALALETIITSYPAADTIH